MIDVDDAEHRAWRAAIDRLVGVWRATTVDVRVVELDREEATVNA